MDDRIEVTLSSPAKVDLRVLMAGVQLVSAAELELLKEAGVIVSLAPVADGASDHSAALSFDQDAFEAAVAVEAGKLVQPFKGAVEELQAEAKQLVIDVETLTMARDEAEAKAAALLSRLDETGKMLTAERQNSADLAEKLTVAEADNAALKAMPALIVNTPVAKTTVKKGAATS